METLVHPEYSLNLTIPLIASFFKILFYFIFYKVSVLVNDAR